jgi:HD-like signal output (HDOD) protein
MVRRRCELSSSEVAELHRRLDVRLKSIGLESQPRVAAALLQLVQSPDAHLHDYTDVIKNDWTLTGRLLKLANSAYYAQRSPVTRLDRALVLLGLGRTKAIALGFTLARAAAPADVKELSRQVWGESVYRASLCMCLARQVAPALAAEAFIVGLLLDCGQPLMAKLLGEPYLALRRETRSPAKLFAAEFERLEFTHCDVAAALFAQWKLPPMLARPVIWHHTLPVGDKTSDASAILQRLAFYAGAVRMGSDEGAAPHASPLASTAGRLFEINQDDLAGVVSHAGREYRSTIELFAGQAQRCEDVDGLADRVHLQLLQLMDDQMAKAIQLETRVSGGARAHVVVAGQRVELEPGQSGGILAFIAAQTGERIISCTIDPATDGPEKLCQRLGIDRVEPIEADELMRAVRSLAA